MEVKQLSLPLREYNIKGNLETGNLETGNLETTEL